MRVWREGQDVNSRLITKENALDGAQKRRPQRQPLGAMEALIRRKLRAHLRDLGFVTDHQGDLLPPRRSKSTVRARHLAQRKDRLSESLDFVKRKIDRLLEYFASGDEVVPRRIRPRLEPVSSGTTAADLFRLASLTWSIPVSEGYGRRMRFLVWDDNNAKVMGIMALGDPVFNLHVRDREIGWEAADRKQRLVDVMDAYVLGALPPYNMLLGGKLIACLVRTKEVRDHFTARYRNAVGLISGEKKRPSLVMVTTSSALGRSSVYNRLSLGGVKYFEPVGFTSGYGHFHVDGKLFDQMRTYLKRKRHPYSADNRFGDGPNWKFRAIRAALEMVGIDRDLLHHGIQREVFLCRMAMNADRVLRGDVKNPSYKGLLPVAEVASLALDRWICPRAHRRPEFAQWHRDNMKSLILMKEKGLA